MTIPKEIADKMKQVNSLMAEIDKWLDENIDLDGSAYHHRQVGDYEHSEWYRFTDEAQGKEQDDGTYCWQQEIGESGDSFEGCCYYPTEDGEYFYVHYWL